MEKNTSRFESFSDGTFAVALTVLALEIRMPDVEGVDNRLLWQMLINKWPEYLTFINAFAVVYLVWLGHHRMVEKLRNTNQSMMFVNALVLLLVTLFPYPTRTAGSYMGTPAAEMAVLIFVLYTACIVLGMMWFNRSMQRHPHLLHEPDKALPALGRLMRMQLGGLLAYLLIAVVALGWPLAAMWLTVLVWIFWGYATWHDH